jgi:hypothetical protein
MRYIFLILNQAERQMVSTYAEILLYILYITVPPKTSREILYARKDNHQRRTFPSFNQPNSLFCQSIPSCRMASQ